MHDKNDIYNLLIQSKRLPEGRYNHSTWDLLTHGTFDFQEASVAGIHEAMHHVLNSTTLFGLLLKVTAYLAREREEYKSQLGELVNNSRNAHEIFATYSSLLLVSPDIATPTWVKERYHHSYVGYVDEAKQILDGVALPHLQFSALYAVIRLCFQSDKLQDSINKGMPFEIPFDEYPDSRLQYIQQLITPGYWRTVEDDYLRRNSDNSVAQMFMQANGNVALEEQYGTPVLNEISMDYQDFIYSRLTADILQPSFSALGFDDHLLVLPRLLEFAEEIAPGELSIGALKAATQPELDSGLSEYENESLKIRTKVLPARVLLFSEISSDEWEYLQFNYENMKHIYIVSRITEKFVHQFQLATEEREWLLQNYPDFVTAILCKEDIDKKDNLLIVILDNPTQIEALSNNNMLILSNSSLLLSTDTEWDVWHDVLDKYSTHTVLFDLTPSYQIDIMAQQYEVIEYAKLYLEFDSVSYPFVCLIASGILPTGLYFMPCSEILANILIEFLSSKPFTKVYNVEKQDNDELNLVLRFGMSHLVDESVFDFHALNTKYALRCFSQNKF